MDISHIRNFLVTAGTLSFTKAADELYKSESVLSRQIKNLEKEIGIKLFVRSSKSISLTPAGRFLADNLDKMCNKLDTLIEEASFIQSGFSGQIRVASLPGQMLHDKFVEILVSFEKAYPNIRLSLDTCDVSEQRAMLQEQQLDFVFGASRDFSFIPDFAYEVIGKVRNYLVIPKTHPLAQKNTEEMRLIDFKDETFILPSESESPAVANFPKRCESAGFEPKCITAPNLSTLMIWMEVQRGISPLDETHVFRDNSKLLFIPMPELGHTELAVIRNTANAKPSNDIFLDYVRKWRPA